MWESRIHPQPKQVLDLATQDGCKAELICYMKADRLGIEPRDLSVASPTPYRSATTQHVKVGLQHVDGKLLAVAI